MDWINDSGIITNAKSQLNSFAVKEKLGENLDDLQKKMHFGIFSYFNIHSVATLCV